MLLAGQPHNDDVPMIQGWDNDHLAAASFDTIAAAIITVKSAEEKQANVSADAEALATQERERLRDLRNTLERLKGALQQKMTQI